MTATLASKKITPTSTEKDNIDKLNQQAWDARIADVQSAIQLSKTAYDKAATVDYKSGLAFSLHTQGHCYFRVGEYEAAQNHTLESLALYEQLADEKGQSDALNTLGNIDSSLGKHQTAYESYLKSLKLRQTAGNKQAEAASWNNIGNVHFHLGDHENALISHQKSLALKKEIGNQSGVATSLNNIGNIYKDAGDFANAREQYVQSLVIFQEIGNQYGEAGALSNLGVIYREIGDLTASLTHHYQSLTIEEAIGNRYGRSESLLQLGQLYTDFPDLPLLPTAGKKRDALSCLQEALSLATELGAIELIFKINKILAQWYEQAGDYRQALAHYQAYHKAEREVFDNERSEHMHKLQIVHQVESSKKETELEHARAELFKLQNIELAAALAEVKEQRQLAEEANAFKTKLLSIAAHDLKTPLTAIYISAGFLLSRLSSDDPLYTQAQYIESGSQRMQKLIDDLLDSTEIEKGSINLQPEIVNLSVLTKEVMDSFKGQAQQKEQQLQVETDIDCFINADPARMWQVLDNLISNAIKFSDKGANISIRVMKEMETICFAVEDEGPGLTESDMELLFQKFTPLSARPTGGESSTGLGLSIVKQLVEMQNGKVWAESAGAQKGSTFYVLMPAANS